MYISKSNAPQRLGRGYDPARLNVRGRYPYNGIEGLGAWYNPASWGRDDDNRPSTIQYSNPKVDSLIALINSSKLARDRKDILISSIKLTMESNFSDTEKARKIGIAVDTMKSYLEEQKYNSMLLQIADAFALTAETVRAGIADTSKNVWSSFKFLTNPVVLTSLALIVGGTLFYFYLVKPAQTVNKMLE